MSTKTLQPDSAGAYARVVQFLRVDTRAAFGIIREDNLLALAPPHARTLVRVRTLSATFTNYVSSFLPCLGEPCVAVTSEAELSAKPTDGFVAPELVRARKLPLFVRSFANISERFTGAENARTSVLGLARLVRGLRLPCLLGGFVREKDAPYP